MNGSRLGSISKMFTSMSREHKRLLLLSVDVVGVFIAYVFTLAVQDQVAILPTLEDSGLLIVPLLMATTAAVATLLKLPRIF